MTKSEQTGEKHLDLKGHLLVAMPGMEDSQFARTVVFICSHSEEGSMGFILNQPVSSPLFTEILDELGLDDELEAVNAEQKDVPVFRGGPVEQGRGFVLHSLDFSSPTSARVYDLAAVTATLDVLRALALAGPPEEALMFLGYAGWSEGQLEQEIVGNGWLTMPATRTLLFDTHHTMQYDAALAAMGISTATLSSSAGHA